MKILSEMKLGAYTGLKIYSLPVWEFWPRVFRQLNDRNGPSAAACLGTSSTSTSNGPGAAASLGTSAASTSNANGARGMEMVISLAL